MIERHYTINEASELIGLKPDTLRRKARAGKFPLAIPPNGDRGKWLFPESSIRIFIGDNGIPRHVHRPLPDRETLKRQLQLDAIKHKEEDKKLQ